jgi:hypothetical protein
MKLQRLLYIVFAMIVSCAPIRRMTPLELGETAVSASLGGPFLETLGWAPAPMLGIAANYGLYKNIDCEAGLSLTSALYGVVNADIGINYRPFMPHCYYPGLILNARFIGTTDFNRGNYRGFPDAAITGFWELPHHYYLYTGLENWFELRDIRYDGNRQKMHLLPLIHCGADKKYSRWDFQVEALWYLPFTDATHHVSNTIEIGKNGMLGCMLGAGRTFGHGTSTRGERHEN